MQKKEKLFQKQAVLMKEMLHEKDLIATQMLRKNDENGLLLRNVSQLQSVMERAAGQYNDRLCDIENLKREIKNLTSQGEALKRGLANSAEMRRQVYVLHRKLNQEKVKSRALHEELMTPMNIHRYVNWNMIDSFALLIHCKSEIAFNMHIWKSLLNVI